MCVSFSYPLGVIEYLYAHMMNKKAPEMSWPMEMLKWEFCLLYMFRTSLDMIYFWCLLGGSNDL